VFTYGASAVLKIVTGDGKIATHTWMATSQLAFEMISV